MVDGKAVETPADGAHEEARRWFRKGSRLAASGKYKEAVSAFEAALRVDSGFADAYFQRGVCFYRLGLLRRAEQDMTAATLLGSETAQLWSRFEGKPVRDGDEEDEEPHER